MKPRSTPWRWRPRNSSAGRSPGEPSSRLTPTLTGHTELGITPACGALVALIELATEKKTYFVGKSNPLMMWTALGTLQTGPAEAFMVGDRMDTDIIAGTEAGMTTILVLSGVTTRELIETYPYRPTHIFEDVGHIPVAELA